MTVKNNEKKIRSFMFCNRKKIQRNYNERNKITQKKRKEMFCIECAKCS